MKKTSSVISILLALLMLFSLTAAAAGGNGGGGSTSGTLTLESAKIGDTLLAEATEIRSNAEILLTFSANVTDESVLAGNISKIKVKDSTGNNVSSVTVSPSGNKKFTVALNGVEKADYTLSIGKDLKDTAGNKVSKTSGKIAVTLGPPAIISVKAGKTSSVTGEKITWTVTAVGSEQPLQYYFVLYKDGVKIKTRSYSTANTFSYTPTKAGSYKVKVYVKDASEAKVNKTSAAVTVS